MRIAAWLLVAAAGFGLMSWSYYGFERPDESLPWASGLMLIGEAPKPGSLEKVKSATIPALFLPGDAISEQLFRKLAKTESSWMLPAFHDKLLEASPQKLGLTAALLDSGRLPVAGRDEVLAGFLTTVRPPYYLYVEGHRFFVVGVLCRDVALLADCYLLPPCGAKPFEQIDQRSTEVQSATLVALSRNEMSKEGKLYLAARAAVPDSPALVSKTRVAKGPFYLYLAGLTVLLVAGSGAFIQLFRLLARKIRRPLLREPLLVLRRWPRLTWALHLTFFGTFILASLLIYEFPRGQEVLLALTHGEFNGHGPLSIAGRAYGSGNIFYAAAVTVGVNFLWGTAVTITAASLVPGLGLLILGLRALMIGMILAPSWVIMAGMMLPHSWTLLIEGEAYVLATIFGLMMPIYLFRRWPGTRWHQRLGLAVRVNLKSWLLTAAILLVAAGYEATEVIMQMR